MYVGEFKDGKRNVKEHTLTVKEESTLENGRKD